MTGTYLKIFFSTTFLCALAVAALSLIVDPFNLHRLDFHNLDRTPAYVLNRNLYRMSELEQLTPSPENTRIIAIGDSTSAQLDAGSMGTAAPSFSWFNASVDGSNLQEVIGMGHYVLENDLADVLMIGFPVRRLTRSPRNLVPQAQDVINGRWAHLMTFDSLWASIRVIGENLLNWRGLESEPAVHQSSIFDYMLERTRNEMQTAKWPDFLETDINSLENHALQNDVSVIYFVPPQDDALDALFTEEFSDWPTKHQLFLQDRCVLDLNPPNDSRWTRDHLKDSVHIKDARRADFSAFVATQLISLDCFAYPDGVD